MRTALFILLSIAITRVSAAESWQRVQLGAGGPFLLIPPGARPYPHNGELDPNRTGGATYGFHVPVTRNAADDDFSVTVALDLPRYHNSGSQRSFDNYWHDDQRTYGESITWARKMPHSVTWVRRDGANKQFHKRFLHPTAPEKFPVRELWITYPRQLVHKCDPWLARIEATFQPFPESNGTPKHF